MVFDKRMQDKPFHLLPLFNVPIHELAGMQSRLAGAGGALYCLSKLVILPCVEVSARRIEVKRRHDSQQHHHTIGQLAWVSGSSWRWHVNGDCCRRVSISTQIGTVNSFTWEHAGVGTMRTPSRWHHLKTLFY